jgi:hypothetical protein
MISMDLLDLADEIEAVLDDECDKYAELREPDSEGGAWRFVLQGDMIGFVSCEANKEDFDIPTVSIAVCMGDVTQAEKKFLFKLLEINGSFVGAHFTVQEMDNSRLLFIEHRQWAETYNPDDFRDHINRLLEQYDMFMQDPEDE